MKPLYALGVYMLMILGWKLLIDRPNERQSNIVRNSILLGLVIYGVFDFTNLAIFDNYTKKSTNKEFLTIIIKSLVKNH